VNDKTPEDRQFAKLLAKGMMLLGTVPGPAEPNAFRHVLRWDRLGRRGQNCRILKHSGALAQIEFEDGFKSWINRSALVRNQSCSKSSLSSPSPTSSSPSSS
jgi:hypothetical protein